MELYKTFLYYDRVVQTLLQKTYRLESKSMELQKCTVLASGLPIDRPFTRASRSA
jgi:hypothetical protein